MAHASESFVAPQPSLYMFQVRLAWSRLKSFPLTPALFKWCLKRAKLFKQSGAARPSSATQLMWTKLNERIFVTLIVLHWVQQPGCSLLFWNQRWMLQNVSVFNLFVVVSLLCTDVGDEIYRTQFAFAAVAVLSLLYPLWETVSSLWTHLFEDNFHLSSTLLFTMRQRLSLLPSDAQFTFYTLSLQRD